MGSRNVKAVLGAAILAGAISFVSVAVEPERAGAATTARTCGGGSIDLKTREKRVFGMHNLARENRGLRPLCVDRQLTRAARSHSREMIEEDYFSHSSHNGESTGERLKRFGYDGRVYAENVAGGSGIYGEPDRTFQGWMDSRGHRANILDGRFRPVGVGTYTGNYRGYRQYTMYTVDFGVRR